MFIFNKNYRVVYGDKTFEQDPLSPAHLPENHEHYNIPLYKLWGMTLEEATEISNTEKWKQIRLYRNKLLTETDWWALQDQTITQQQIDYRKALRDITTSNIEDVVFPVKPED
jgi:hypothetical protein